MFGYMFLKHWIKPNLIKIMITAAVKDPSRFGKTIQERKFVVNFQKKEQDLDQVLQAITYQVI